MKLKLASMKLGEGVWYTIERAEHEGRQWLQQNPDGGASFMCSSRICDASVEGPIEDMQGIAKAIRERGSAHFYRCSVKFTGDGFSFTSPRNATTEGEVTIDEADDLASQIEAIQ